MKKSTIFIILAIVFGLISISKLVIEEFNGGLAYGLIGLAVTFAAKRALKNEKAG